MTQTLVHQMAKRVDSLSWDPEFIQAHLLDSGPLFLVVNLGDGKVVTEESWSDVFQTNTGREISLILKERDQFAAAPDNAPSEGSSIRSVDNELEDVIDSTKDSNIRYHYKSPKGKEKSSDSQMTASHVRDAHSWPRRTIASLSDVPKTSSNHEQSKIGMKKNRTTSRGHPSKRRPSSNQEEGTEGEMNTVSSGTQAKTGGELARSTDERAPTANINAKAMVAFQQPQVSSAASRSALMLSRSAYSAPTPVTPSNWLPSRQAAPPLSIIRPVIPSVRSLPHSYAPQNAAYSMPPSTATMVDHRLPSPNWNSAPGMPSFLPYSTNHSYQYRSLGSGKASPQDLAYVPSPKRLRAAASTVEAQSTFLDTEKERSMEHFTTLTRRSKGRRLQDTDLSDVHDSETYRVDRERCLQWHKNCSEALRHREKMTTFPEPPDWPCKDHDKYENSRALRACKCNLRKVYKLLG